MSSAQRQAFVLHEIAEGSWRLCDDSVDDHHPLKVVAYVERTAQGDFEVVWVRGAPGVSRHDTHDEILTAAERIEPTRKERDKPDPIPHLPPLTRRRPTRVRRERPTRPERL